MRIVVILAAFLLLSAAPPRVAPGAAVRPSPGGRPVIVDRWEVTAGRFAACVAAGRCRAADVDAGGVCTYNNPAKAEHPINCVTHYGAAAFCAYAGGRLCKEDEWFAACRGPEGRDYPYGAQYEPSRCNGAGGEDVRGETAPVGGFPGCRSGTDGPFDMVGNVAEWVDSCDGDYCHFYGGAYRTNAPADLFLSCKRFCAGNQKSLKSATVGFRCCRDAPVPL